MHRRFLLLTVCMLASSLVASAQQFTIRQNVTGNNRADIRGQVFRPAEQGSGTGSITSDDDVYLTSFSVVYAAGTEATTLYIYSVLPSSTTLLDNGSAPNLVGESSSVTEDFPYTVYHFDHLVLDKNTTYYALFRQDVTLEFGGSGSTDGPYPGGKMLINTAGVLIANNFTALKFEAEFANELLPDAGDVAALTALYNSTNGANWTNKWNLAGDPFAWHGVAWSGTRVVQINIISNNLVGNLPSALGNLTNLNTLWLPFNSLSGTIPASLGNLNNLESLSLYSNNLSGSIPSELGSLSNLIMLQLGRNNLSGLVPSEIGNLTNLKSLILESNSLTGSVPTSFANLTSLEFLNLGSNSFTGMEVDLGGLSNLTSLSLSGIPLGPIPAWVFELTNLNYLTLTNCSLEDELSSDVGELVNLKGLSLETNSLTGSIPASIANLTSLSSLSLHNNMFSGSLPSSLGDLSQLVVIYAQNNKLTGSIPASLGNLSNLQSLWLNGNELTGEIPTELGNLTNLQSLFLSDNLLEGNVPSSVGNIINLHTLGLDKNSLSGVLPTSLSSLSNLENLYLDENRFDFGSFEPVSSLIASTTVSRISPQKKLAVNESTVIVALGNQLQIDITTAGANNLYQWFRGSTALGTPGSNSMLTIDAFQVENAGTYVCKVTNTSVPGLVLESENIVVTYTVGFDEGFPVISEAKAKQFTINFNLTKNGEVHYVVSPSGLPAPSVQQILNGLTGEGEDALKAGSIVVTISASVPVTVEGLQPTTSYVIYSVATDDFGTVSSIQTTSVTTEAGINFADQYPRMQQAEAEEITIAAKTSKSGEVYFVVLTPGTASPTAQQVIAKQDGTGASTQMGGQETVTANTELIITIASLTSESPYDVYLVAMDDEDIFTEVAKIEAATITGLEQKSGVYVNVFPNPSSDYIEVHTTETSAMHIQLTDIQGRVFHSKLINSEPTRIDVMDFPQGIYFLHYDAASTSGYIKLLKK